MGRQGDLRRALARILWVGGSPCAGKSTLAAILAGRHGLALYRCDEALTGHLQRATPTAQPMMHKLTNMPWNDLWRRPVDAQIHQELAFYQEEFPFVLEDLLDFPTTTPVIAEGTALLPELVAPLLTDRRRAVWLVPSADFQREHYSRRPWIHDILRQCDDPAQAFENWMQRDIGFADTAERRAKERRLQVLRVDGTLRVEALTTIAEGWFRLSP
jgi:2-phosphoglycerate kinase